LLARKKFAFFVHRPLVPDTSVFLLLLRAAPCSPSRTAPPPEVPFFPCGHPQKPGMSFPSLYPPFRAMIFISLCSLPHIGTSFTFLVEQMFLPPILPRPSFQSCLGQRFSLTSAFQNTFSQPQRKVTPFSPLLSDFVLPFPIGLAFSPCAVFSSLSCSIRLSAQIACESFSSRNSERCS